MRPRRQPVVQLLVSLTVVVAATLAVAVVRRSDQHPTADTPSPAGGYHASHDHGAPPSPGDMTAAPVAAVDLGFAQDMIDHHRQALQMALLALDKATTEPVRTLATEVVVSQQLETGRLLQFLTERGQREGDPNRTVMAWMGTPMPHDRMPGLASPEDMLALTRATGRDVDRQFVTLMTRHHEGGVHMAEHARDHAQTASIRDLAGFMAVTQQREINELEQIAQGLG